MENQTDLGGSKLTQEWSLYIHIYMCVYGITCISMYMISGVQTDVECFIKTQSGLGFSGLSRISE